MLVNYLLRSIEKYFIVVLLASFIGHSERVFSQYNLHFKLYTSSEGLPSGSFREIIKSPNGYLWLHSENGISKFNGYDFTTYYFKSINDKSLSSTPMLKTFIDSLGNLFLTSKNSIYLFDNRTNEFVKLLQFNNPNDLIFFESDKHFSYALIKNNLYTISFNPLRITKTVIPNVSFYKYSTSSLLSNGKLYLTTTHQLLLIDLGTMKMQKRHFNIPIKFPVFLNELKNGSIQISSTKQLFNYLPLDNKIIEFTARPSEYSNTRNNPNIKLEINNCIYHLNRFGILTKLDLISGQVYTLDLANLLKQKISKEIIFYSISKGVKNNLWIENTGAGLIEIDLQNFERGIKNHLFDKNSNLSSNNCNNILEDNEGIIWFLSVGKGLMKVEKIKSNFTTIYPRSDPSNIATSNVRSIGEFAKNKIVVGTLEGSYFIDISVNDKFTPLNFDYYDSKMPISNIALDQYGKIWLTSWLNKNILLINPVKETATLFNRKDSSKYGNTIFRCSLIDKDNIYFGSSNNSIFVSHLKSFESENDPREITFKRDEFSKNMGIIFCLKKMNDDIIIGSQNGLYIYSTKNDSLKAFQGKKESKIKLDNVDIRSIHKKDDSVLWIGTNGNGLLKLNLTTHEVKQYTVEDGLSDNFIYTILEDGHGNFWMGTNTGLNKFDPISENFQFYTGKDGLGFDEFNTNAAYKLSNGRMAFGGINGLVLFHPDSIKYTSVPFDIYQTHFFVNNMPYKIDSSYVLKYDQNYLSFQFAALTFFRNEDIKYAYKMVGLDDDWILSGTRRFTTYANLHPGTYTFQVRCTNPNGVWNKDILSISILIMNPWYKEWYAVSLYIILILIFTWGIIKYRQNQRLKLQNIRDNIARDLHDEIGSNLSSISIFNEVAKESALRNTGNLTSVLNKIGEYTQVSQEAMNDIVWMIDSKNERFENIFVKMRTLASETIGSGSYAMSLNFDESLNDIKIPMTKRKNFYLIYKEAINNLLKYSQCTHVNIEVRKVGNHVLLHIEDNGVGFVIDENKGNGLTNMRKRAAELQGDLQISSTIGKGTVIKLKFYI